MKPLLHYFRKDPWYVRVIVLVFSWIFMLALPSSVAQSSWIAIRYLTPDKQADTATAESIRPDSVADSSDGRKQRQARTRGRKVQRRADRFASKASP